MPPTPDRPPKPAVPARGRASSPPIQKPAVPAQGGQPSTPFPPKPNVPTKPTAKPSKPIAPRPIASPLALPAKQVPPPKPKTESKREANSWSLRISVPVWWSIVIGVGISLILCFEIGYSLGERRSARLLPESQTEVAAAKPADTPAQTPAGSKSSTKPVPAEGRPKEPIKTTPIETPKKTNPPMPSVPSVTPSVKEKPSKPMEPAKPMEPMIALKFEKDILPIFQSKCISCHGQLSKRGGLDLRSLASLTRGGNSGPGMKPGQPDDSPLWQSVKMGQMPPPNKPQLTVDEKGLILAWIAGGGK